MSTMHAVVRNALLVWVAMAMGMPQHAAAHWCSNIFIAPSRLVVRPERDTVHLSGTSATELRVYLRNNFPYRLFNVRMRGNASGYSVGVSPADQPIHPGQTVAYVLSITPDGGGTGDVPVTNLDLQVQFRFGGWQSESTCHVDENPGATLLRQITIWDNRVTLCDRTHGSQSSALAAATMADQHPTTSLGSGAPFFGRTGIQQLIHWFGYRFCYNTGGSWRSLSEDCPSPQPEGSSWTSTVQFPQNCMRAGVELAARKPALNSADLSAARQAAINALGPGGSGEHKCIAAVVGGHLWSNASSPSSFTSALSDGANAVPSGCQDAGRRALDGSNGSNCTSGQYYERAACAAAEGLRDNDSPVINVLMANAGDGIGGLAGYPGLYHAYLLKLVVADREQRHGNVSFYPVLTDCDSVTECTGGDGCCPSGCHANNDSDCEPVCDNGELESGETCEPRSTCPTQCSDGDVCTRDVLTGSASSCSSVCSYPSITSCTNGDGCCAPGCNANNDNDCEPVCNNGAVEAGESCDPRSSCPTECNDGNACTRDVFSGSAAACTAACAYPLITQCADDDGCCPAGCVQGDDSDCSATCGNGVVDTEENETCDPPASCPTSCSAPDACTTATLVGSAANCNAACVNTPITQCTGGDGCCPAACSYAVDSDCPPPIEPDAGVEPDAAVDAGATDGSQLSDGQVDDQGSVDASDDAGALADGGSRTDGSHPRDGGILDRFSLRGGCGVAAGAPHDGLPGIVVLLLLGWAATLRRRR